MAKKKKGSNKKKKITTNTNEKEQQDAKEEDAPAISTADEQQEDPSCDPSTNGAETTSVKEEELAATPDEVAVIENETPVLESNVAHGDVISSYGVEYPNQEPTKQQQNKVPNVIPTAATEEAAVGEDDADTSNVGDDVLVDTEPAPPVISPEDLNTKIETKPSEADNDDQEVEGETLLPTKKEEKMTKTEKRKFEADEEVVTGEPKPVAEEETGNAAVEAESIEPEVATFESEKGSNDVVAEDKARKEPTPDVEPSEVKDAIPVNPTVHESPSDELQLLVVHYNTVSASASTSAGTETRSSPTKEETIVGDVVVVEEEKKCDTEHSKRKLVTAVEESPQDEPESMVAVDDSSSEPLKAPQPKDDEFPEDEKNGMMLAPHEADWNEECKRTEESTSVTETVTPANNNPRGLTFAQAFGSPSGNAVSPLASPAMTVSEPRKVQSSEESNDERKEGDPKPTPRGMTFARAFGNEPPPAVSPLATPASSIDVGTAAEITLDRQLSTRSDKSSHSALSAAKHKKVSGLMSKYMEEVSHEPKPGDSIPLRRKSPGPSPSNSFSFASQDTPLSAQSVKQKMAITEVELAQLPNIDVVREKFESSSRSTGSSQVFEFGESFRQKKRFEQLSDREKEMEAKAAMRGFNEKDLFPGRSASGEVDSSSLSKTYTFEMSTNASMMAPDGKCRVNYKNADYTAMVFVVHRTRGMLLLHIKASGGPTQKCQIPGGLVLEDEFLKAAKQSGDSQVQLQIAAREAAARQLYEKTGLDIRHDVDRFKPAILRLNPPVGPKGVQYLKNEYKSKLYYFLQVDEDDFISPCAVGELEPSQKLTRPTLDPGDSPLTLRLCDDYGGFTFVLDPADAANVLNEDGSKEATDALRMIMNEASGEVANKNAQKSGPDAKATEYHSVSGLSAPADEKNGTLTGGNIRTVCEKGNEKGTFRQDAELNLKSSSESHEVGFTCCCGWW
jgi:8-oxo-dGTP pyrophosphatase MutT (NUDIX family)